MAVRTGKTRLQQFGECDMSKLFLALGPMRTGTTSMFDHIKQMDPFIRDEIINYVGLPHGGFNSIPHKDIKRMALKENDSLIPLWLNSKTGHPMDCVFDKRGFDTAWQSVEHLMDPTKHNWWINPCFNVAGMYLNPLLKYSTDRTVTLKNHKQLWQKPIEHFVSVLKHISLQVDLTVIFGVRHPTLWLQSVYQYCRKFHKDVKPVDKTSKFLKAAPQSRLFITLFGDDEKTEQFIKLALFNEQPQDPDDLRIYWCITALCKTITQMAYAVDLCEQQGIKTELYHTERLNSINPFGGDMSVGQFPHSWTQADSNVHHQMVNNYDWLTDAISHVTHLEEQKSYYKLHQIVCSKPRGFMG